MTTTSAATFTYSHTVGFLAYRGRGFIHPHPGPDARR